ncbi:hypothetical protein SPSYN_03084 [Sporotomaculum syntrophicum]|uniref:Type I-B CRISPR-associated protein Cas8b1/Cst1 n=1 Tax=Sporotomaculum syntrophicum TaxID=182264 RepID=A0A9D2WMJ2_9FIRM|nr:hypothetical protein [Sporotomaculum syntrophicum]KAF1083735.1 hypothetical protein SPSYN_03084 [Sporotomaculum syntrophicum]
MQLKLYMDDYLTAIGGTGLLRLQEWAHLNLGTVVGLQHADSPIKMKHDHLLVDPSILTRVPEWYFRFLLEQYSISKREEKRLRYIGNSKNQTVKEQKDRLKDSINENLKKLSRYFAETENYQLMKECFEQVKKLPDDQAKTSLTDLRDNYLQLLQTDIFEEKLTFNFIRSVVLKNFFGQVSFLQKSLSHYNLQQHIDKMTEDYVRPLLFDLGFHDLLYSSLPDDEKYQAVLQYLAKSELSIHKRWVRELKKLKPGNLEAYFRQQLRCVFEENWLATDNFEEKSFVPLGVSSGKAYNFAWDLQDSPMPISTWIRFILFISPVGLTPFTKMYKEGFETYYSFVFRDGSPDLIYRDNEVLRNLEQNESFEQFIPKIIRREQHKAKQESIPGIQIIEFYSEYDNKKTVMHYYHIPQYLLEYFKQDNLNKMHKIYDRSLRDQFLQLVMESVDPISTIWVHLQKVIRGKANAQSTYYALLERWKINSLQEEGTMRNAGLIYVVFKEGKKIRKELTNLSNERSEQTDYASSGNKRAAGIAHRLLNAAKAGNNQQFLDTIIRLYLQVKIPVPSLLLNVLHEKDIDFATLSGAFITGLLSDADYTAVDKTEQSEQQTVQAVNP